MFVASNNLPNYQKYYFKVKAIAFNIHLPNYIFMRCFVPEFSRKLFLGLPISQITIFSYKPSDKIFFFVLYSSENVVMLFTTPFQKRDLDSRSSEILFSTTLYISNKIYPPSLHWWCCNFAFIPSEIYSWYFFGKTTPFRKSCLYQGWGGFKME